MFVFAGEDPDPRLAGKDFCICLVNKDVYINVHYRLYMLYTVQAKIVYLLSLHFEFET